MADTNASTNRLRALTVPHQRTSECAPFHCESHDVDELLDVGQGRGYLVCFECGHFYRTPGELRRAHRAVLWQLVRSGPMPWRAWPRFLWRQATFRASQVNTCAHCHHDF